MACSCPAILFNSNTCAAVACSCPAILFNSTRCAAVGCMIRNNMTFFQTLFQSTEMSSEGCPLNPAASASTQIAADPENSASSSGSLHIQQPPGFCHSHALSAVPLQTLCARILLAQVGGASEGLQSGAPVGGASRGRAPASHPSSSPPHSRAVPGW